MEGDHHLVGKIQAYSTIAFLTKSFKINTLDINFLDSSGPTPTAMVTPNSLNSPCPTPTADSTSNHTAVITPESPNSSGPIPTSSSSADIPTSTTINRVNTLDPMPTTIITLKIVLPLYPVYIGLPHTNCSQYYDIHSTKITSVIAGTCVE